MEQAKLIRLHKFIAEAGVTSRRKAEQLVEDGKVKVNGEKVSRQGMLVDPSADLVEIDGKIVKKSTSLVYIALHKPEGYISSTANTEGKSVLQLIKGEKSRLYPVGRLDKESSGLLILTNDGDFTNKVTHPRYGCTKEYFVILDRDLDDESAQKLEKGIRTQGKKLEPIKVLSKQNKSARLELREGVNREIRTAMGKLGYEVRRLKRIRVGKLELGELKAGQWRKIYKTDVI